MASWHPPIPCGAFYSPHAIALGPGLALLAWCYDHVERDGWVNVRLEDAASDIGKPYGTIRDWWKLMREGPFFSETVARGKLGWRVRFKDKWLDWHVMKNNYPVERGNISDDGADKERTTSEQEDNGDRGHVSEQPEIEPVSAPLPLANAPLERGNISDNGNAYKVLHNDQKTHVVRRRASAPDEPPTPKEIREAVASVSSIDLKAGLQADIIQVNKTAKHLWKHMRQPDQTADSLATEVRGNGRWIRQSQHPYKGSEQRIPPSALIKFWPAAMAALQTRSSPTNGTNGHHPPPVVIPPEELATNEDFAALFQGLHGIGKAHDSTSTDTAPQLGSRKRPDRGPGHKP